ncbi:MAG TPA: potassium channel family protein, partial [Candidatus Synoicihabitans sp.]|nr:potassium channel family protein [Candidatus Synoicihabitans sp.]
GVAAISVIAFIVVSFGSAGILLVERTPEANIRTAEDALWWSMTTVTTVGYGDRYPVTTAGRVIATALMICGIGIFGTLSGVAAGLFLGNDRDEPASREAQRELLAQVDALQRELAALKAAATSTSQSPPPPPSEGSTGSSTST